ncbi:MAG: DNA-directed DNA polymerase II small subunit [Candidatus Thorarchaeota archaeon]
MISDKHQEKRLIVNRLATSGINITPESLEIIMSFENPLEMLNLIIRETSFIPSFNSYITVNMLQKISNEEIQKMLQRVISKEISLDKLAFISFDKKPQVDIVDSSQNSDNLQKENSIKKRIEGNPQEIFAIPPVENLSINLKIPVRKSIKSKINKSAKSSLQFKPIAKDYDFSYEILKDPTGKLYTNGEYDDFYNLNLDKYNKLKNLMRKRPEMKAAININNIYRLSRNFEISTLGLVNDIYQTKNGNYIISLEDTTGAINVLIRNDSDHAEYFHIIERTVKDQMLYVDGIYKPGEQGRLGIIFANSISKIDIPANYEPNLSEEPLSIALISDLHIGSREFEEKLFIKFLDFLNGKSNNPKFREIASKIKYILINGDLVDGVGVYPNQQEDLIISDIYKQYETAAKLLSRIPDYIKIFYIAGNHEPVRNAIPRPAVSKKYCEELVDLGIKCLGNPSLINTHNVNSLVYHGESIHDMNLLIHELNINNPVETMKEFLICRHLAPVFGEKTQIAPLDNDWLVIDKIPDIFHTGHIHINGIGKYRNVSLVNSGCFQAQTEFMRSFGIIPTPGITPIVELDTLNIFPLDFKKID